MTHFIVNLSITIQELDTEDKLNMPVKRDLKATFTDNDRDLLDLMGRQMKKLEGWLEQNVPATEIPGTTGPSRIITMPGKNEKES